MFCLLYAVFSIPDYKKGRTQYCLSPYLFGSALVSLRSK